MSIYTEHFETVFSAKQNIKALRNKVLKLAIQGKLVEHDPNDEPANMLVEQITEEKVQLIHKQQIKKEKALPEITVEGIPYVVPVGWKWVRLNEILDVRDGTHDTPKYVPEGIPLVTSKNLKNGEIDFSNVKYISESDHASIEKRSRVDDNDILFAMIGSIGNAVVVKKDNDFSIKNMALFKNYPNRKINMQYVKICLDAMEDKLKQQASGGVQSFLSLKYLRELLFPLPPSVEQARIVAKVESLMSEIGKLEHYIERKEQLETAIPQAVVSAISKCQNEEELKAQLALVIAHFTDVFQTPESLQELRNVILKLGIQGKLVSQNPADEPASELLKNIQAEKGLLIKEKKIKKEKVLPQVEEDEIPFEIPDKWQWCRLGDISLLTMGQSPDGQSVSTQEDGIEFHQGKIYFDDVFIKESPQRTTETKKVVEANTTLLSVRAPVGILNITPRKISIGRGLCGVNTLGEMDEFFYFYFLKAYAAYFDEKSTGTTFKAITGEVIKNTPIPLPPLEEQRRIVKKVESLFNIIGQLEIAMLKRKRLVGNMALV